MVRSLGGPQPAVASVELAGAVVLLPARDEGIARRLGWSAKRPEFVVLERALRVLRSHGLAAPGSAFVDVGANLGTTTLPAITAHGFGRAVAVEPDPESARHLRASVALNGLDDRVAVVEAAAADVSGRMSFGRGRSAKGEWSSGVGSLSRAAKTDDAIEVAVVTVDEVLGANAIPSSEVGLLWIDAQGHEGHVLAGAADLVTAGVPIVLAYRPKKIRRGGGRPHLDEALTGYDTVVDLRRPSLKDDPGWQPELRPASQLDDMPLRSRSTDVLVFRAGVTLS